MRHVETPQGLCQLGVARCDITPPVGIYHRMWGAATHERATGVHRPLTATALAFQADGPATGPEAEQVLVAVDHCLLWAREMDALLASVSRDTGLRREQLSIAYSHTHAGGLMDLNRVTLPGGDLIPPYLDELAGRIADIVRSARQGLRPAALTYATGRCPMAGNRDYPDEATGQIVCGFNPPAPRTIPSSPCAPVMPEKRRSPPSSITPVIRRRWPGRTRSSVPIIPERCAR